MKREEYNNITNQNLIKIMEKSATDENRENVVNPCGCTHTHTFSLINFKNINNLQIGSQYFCEPYLAIIK